MPQADGRVLNEALVTPSSKSQLLVTATTETPARPPPGSASSRGPIRPAIRRIRPGRRHLHDQLTLSGGWKGYKVVNRAKPIVSGGLASGTIDARDWFLPQAGGVFRLTPGAELFANYTQNLRVYASAATGATPFATTQAGFDAIKSALKPERSKTYQAGGRFRAGGLQVRSRPITSTSRTGCWR